MIVRGRPTAGDLQAVQPQEVARPGAQPVPAVARLAVVAGRAGPRQPRHPDAAEPRLRRRGGRTAADPFFWFLPHETYLITVKEEPAIDLATYVSEVLPALAGRRPPDADPPADRLAGATWSARCTSGRCRTAT